MREHHVTTSCEFCNDLRVIIEKSWEGKIHLEFKSPGYWSPHVEAWLTERDWQTFKRAVNAFDREKPKRKRRR